MAITSAQPNTSDLDRVHDCLRPLQEFWSNCDSQCWGIRTNNAVCTAYSWLRVDLVTLN